MVQETEFKSIEDRPKIWKDYLAQGGNPHGIVRHMFLDYSRYYEARLVSNALLNELESLRILDYGCGVGDYGIYLLRAGAKQVDFWDFPRATDLVDYRLKLEGLNGRAISADDNRHPNFLDYDLVIFGEVLEHLENPLRILKNCKTAEVKYLFTSSYPYRTEDKDDPYWSNHDHDDNARLQIPESKKVLEDNYTYEKFAGELRLWKLK